MNGGVREKREQTIDETCGLFFVQKAKFNKRLCHMGRIGPGGGEL